MKKVPWQMQPNQSCAFQNSLGKPSILLVWET